MDIDVRLVIKRSIRLPESEEDGGGQEVGIVRGAAATASSEVEDEGRETSTMSSFW